MKLRSLLFVPGDRPERMEKALRTGADALILDLEDSVTAEKKPEAREAVRAFLKSAGRKVALFVRINPRSEEHTSELQSLMRISYAVFCLKKKKEIHV